MLKAFSKGIDQLSDKNTRKFLWLAVLAAIGTLIVLWIALGEILTRTAITDISWLEAAIDILGGATALVLTWFLFPATVSAVVGFFLEDIAAAVEAKHYPALPAAVGQSLA
ncbi:MAG: EI24 domain-containing protein, partial [Proteobacteria bacterium]|nr:EI24 domain-containing protein [Pseudomonadota bacterium]